jgi:hypothetical protein
MFDTKAYLDDRGINYKSEGKNISSGWIGINCPFCGDQSNHLGIKETGFNCWRCGTKGNIVKLIQEIDSCNYYQACDTIRLFESALFPDLKSDIRKRLGDKILPAESSKTFPEIHSDYLQNRGFNPSFLIEKYNLYACYNLGNYKFRVIIPIIEDGSVVNFTALAVSGQIPKYIHCNNQQAIIPMKECLYNIESVKDIALIVEGVTDVWRMGDGCVATMGTEYTTEQVKLLVDKGVKKAHVMFDSEDFAIKKARKLANSLSVFMDSETIELETGDPGDFTDQQALELREEIGL